MSNHVLEYTGTELDTMLDSIDDKAPKASPALTGTPTAPTAAAGTNTTQIATTAFVTTAINNIATVGTGADAETLILG